MTSLLVAIVPFALLAVLLWPAEFPPSISRSASPTQLVVCAVVASLLGALFPTLLSRVASRIASRLDGPATRERDSSTTPVDEMMRRNKRADGSSSSLYGLDHAILNIPSLIPQTMWMNMGYWKNASHLPQACEALVEKILQNAGLATSTQESSGQDIGTPSQGKKRRVLLDLGFGCGEQTLYLMRRKEEGDDGEENAPLFERYVGITLDKTQYAFAKVRIDAAKGKNAHTTARTDIFCADAAKPSSWPLELQEAVDSAFRTSQDGEAADRETERYVLALDTLYHFRPSRREIFRYSHSALRANFLAFDIFLAPPPASRTLKSILDSLFLRLLTPALSAPFSNFVTQEAYKAQLKAAGYAEEDITIDDITDDVFPGLATFLETRQRDLTALGLSGFSKWRISGWLFRWLAAGDVLRAGVVVARWRRD
ncbi:hypothetical protein VTO42DRAFT_7088 [Malbranchea cinnamomea]